MARYLSLAAAVVVLAACGGSSSGPRQPSDPCANVSFQGTCTAANEVSYCVVPSGDGVPTAMSFTCLAGEACQVVNGQAKCVLTGACRDGETQCTSDTQIRSCSGGAWSTPSTCTNGCNPSPLGAGCSPIAAAGTVDFNGTLQFEARMPNGGLTDWGAVPGTFYARGFLVLSYYETSTPGAFELLDAVYTSDVGAFAVKVRTQATRGANDYLVFAAVAADAGGARITYAVGDPMFASPGQRSPGSLGASPRLWSWSYGLPSGLDTDTVTIPVDSAAGAIVYDWLQEAWKKGQTTFGRDGLSIVIWLGMGTTWSCGACFAHMPGLLAGLPFESQAFFSADPVDQAYWADSVTVHELGHWIMASYGKSPNEGGPHILGLPTFPGQAWSEGFASFFSSEVRNDPVYLDKQGGTMFWINHQTRTYPGATWQRPSAAAPLIQMMAENEVTAMLWALSGNGANDAPIYGALASTRMTQSPWARGYTRYTWKLTGTTYSNVVDTGQSAPFIADELDAMMCAGFSSVEMDAAIEPATYLPYPSGSPICD